jgi:hypothetical protein
MLAKTKRTNQASARALAHRKLLHQEAELGGRLFGPIAVGSRREFFCLDEHTWIWHEEQRDASGAVRAVMTRYDILPYGIRKAQDNQPYQYISQAEARRLYAAIDLYNQIIDAELYTEPVAAA